MLAHWLFFYFILSLSLYLRCSDPSGDGGVEFMVDYEVFSHAVSFLGVGIGNFMEWPASLISAFFGEGRTAPLSCLT